MSPRRTPIGPGIVLVLALVIGGWFLQQGIAQEEEAFTQSRLFQEVVGYISEQYVDEVDEDELYEYAIDGVIERLGDPNTSLLRSNEYEDFRIQTQGDYGGVGLQILDRDGFITVISPIPGGPGARAGLRPGDRIVEVEGASTEGWSEEQAVELLRGEPGSEVRVGIERPGLDASIDFTLTREQIQLRSVPFATVLDGDVGYVPLSLFSETSTSEVRAAADSLRNESARALILDLRGNPGGVLDQGVGVTDLFLERGFDIVETRGQQGGPNGTFRASSRDRYDGMPIVVLVDRGSASASEIVAGALQDHDRALLIGNSTFGKGSVQSLFFGLSGGNTLKLTTARWYTPLGRSIERMRGDSPTGPPLSRASDDPLPITITGAYAVVPDTTGRPTVTSAGGRSLYGGGGIVPDLIVSFDTLSTPEQNAVRELHGVAGLYATARFNHAVEYLRQNEGVTEDFELGESELEGLMERLAAETELDIDRETFELASRFVTLDLEAEVALQGWGAEGQFLRRLPYDAQLQTALELLRGVESTPEMFSAAGRPLPGGSTASGADD